MNNLECGPGVVMKKILLTVILMAFASWIHAAPILDCGPYTIDSRLSSYYDQPEQFRLFALDFQEYNRENRDLGFPYLSSSGILEAIKSINSKIDAQDKLTCNKFESIEKQVNSRFEFIEKSIAVARVEMDRRLEGMNEFRAQLSSQTVTFPTRTEMKSEIDKVGIKVDINSAEIVNIKRDMAAQEGAKRWADYIITIIISAGVVIALRMVFKV